MTDIYVDAWRAWGALSSPDKIEFIRAASAILAVQAELGPTAFMPPSQALTGRVGRQSATQTAPVAAIPSSSHAHEPESLPLIGGSNFDLNTIEGFEEPEFRRHFQPGAKIEVYLAGCGGLKRLAGRLKSAGLVRSHLYKVGTCAHGSLEERLARVSRAAYASRWRQGSDTLEEAGFDSWSVEPLSAHSASTSPGSPVEIGYTSLVVELPASMSPARFDLELNRRLATATLQAFALSACGRVMLEAAGEDPDRFIRFSPCDKTSIERARELTFIRPQTDLTRLVRVIEQMIVSEAMS